jgi:hypothetical protein
VGVGERGQQVIEEHVVIVVEVAPVRRHFRHRVRAELSAGGRIILCAALYISALIRYRKHTW